MNTRQKLTLGIAAIFMVTLTIVGVTYAYFVTRVTGDTTESVNVTTATLGDVVYEAGNGTNDVVTLANVLPGAKVYKTFSVTNQNTDTNVTSYFKIVASNWVPAPLTVGEGEEAVTTTFGEFLHGNGGSNQLVKAGTDATAEETAAYNTFLQTCFGYTKAETTIGAGYTAAVNPKMSTETDASDLCFADDTKYNNIRLTLWEIDEAAMETYADGTGTDPKDGDNVKTPLVDSAQITYAATNESLYAGTGAGISIAGTATRYYVLKVEYLDTVNNGIDGDDNQNAENLAGIEIKVNISA